MPSLRFLIITSLGPSFRSHSTKKPFLKIIYNKEPSKKNREKLTLPPFLSTKCPHWFKPSLLSVRTHRKFQRIRCVLHQKVRTSASEEPPCPHNVRTGKPPLLPDSGRLFWIVPNKIYVLRSDHFPRKLFLKKKKMQYTSVPIWFEDFGWNWVWDYALDLTLG